MIATSPPTTVRTHLRALLVPATAAVALALVVGALAGSLGLGSPFDEHTHYDYVDKIASGNLPTVYGPLGQNALRTFQCAGPEQVWGPKRCGDDYRDPAAAPFAGVSYATSYFPLYYGSTAVVTRALDAVDRGGTRFEHARLANLGWLALLAFLASGILTMVGRRPHAAALLPLGVVLMPSVLLATTHVNNDAGALGLVLAPTFAWLLLAGRSARARLAATIALAITACLMKETALVALAPPAALEMARMRGRSPGRLSVGEAARIGGAGLSIAAAVVAGTGALRLADGLVRDRALGESSMEELLRSIEPTTEQFLTSIVTTPLGTVAQGVAGPSAAPWWVAIAQLLVIAAMGTGLFRLTAGRHRGGLTQADVALAASTVALLLFPVAFLIALHATHQPIFFQPRYLTPALVLVIVMFCGGLSQRSASWYGLGFAAWYALAVVALAG